MEIELSKFIWAIATMALFYALILFAFMVVFPNQQRKIKERQAAKQKKKVDDVFNEYPTLFTQKGFNNYN